MARDMNGLIARLQPTNGTPSNQLKVLRLLGVRGVATTDQIETLSGLSYDAAYKALNQLSTSQGGVDPALRIAHVGLEGEKGKPRRAHILTDTGAAALRAIDDIADLRAPRLEEHTEIAAAVMAMDIYTAARQANLNAQVERVLPFGKDGSSIRADVLITSETGEMKIFECEQTAAAWSKARIQDKLRRMTRFFDSKGGNQVQKDVRVLFNTHPDDTQTTHIWEEQLAVVEREYGKSLLFSLHWQRLVDFLKKLEWETVSGFQLLKPAQLGESTEKSTTSTPRTGDLLNILPVIQGTTSGMKDLELLLGLMYEDQQEVFRQYQASQSPRQRAKAFFDLMLFIYKASHYYNSPTLDYATLPVESLYLLRRYLHAHQNAKLFSQIKQGLATAAKNADGVTRYRNAMTHFIWDVFLRWHGFARGGPLKVNVEPPGFETGRSDFYVEVHVRNPDMFSRPYIFHTNFYDMEPEEKALAWVLEAMINYPNELGLE